MALRYVKLPR